METSNPVIIHYCEFRGVGLLSYSPHVPKLTRWQSVLAYLRVLFE